MEFNYTPGPWWIDDDGLIASGTGDTYCTVAQLVSGNPNDAELIASAPEYHAALELIAAGNTDPDGMVAAARTALCLTKGESQ